MFSDVSRANHNHSCGSILTLHKSSYTAVECRVLSATEWTKLNSAIREPIIQCRISNSHCALVLEMLQTQEFISQDGQ